MKKLLLSFSLLLLPISSPHAETLTIGVIAPFSGDVAFYGNGFRAGIELAKSQYKGDATIDIRYEDDKGLKPAEAVKALQRIQASSPPDILLNGAVNTTMALDKIIHRTGVPTLVLLDSNEEIQKLSPSIFGFGFSTEAIGADLAHAGLKKHPQGKVAILEGENEFSNLVAKNFRKNWTGEVVLDETYPDTATDFRATISKLIQRGAEVVLASPLPPAQTSLLKQLRELGFKGTILALDSFVQQDVDAMGKNAEGIFVSQSWFMNTSFKEKIEKQEKRVVDEVMLSHAALGYDALNCALQAAISEGSIVKGKALLESFKKTNCSGISGSADFSSGRLSTRKEVMLEVKGGKFVPFKF